MNIAARMGSVVYSIEIYYCGPPPSTKEDGVGDIRSGRSRRRTNCQSLKVLLPAEVSLHAVFFNFIQRLATPTILAQAAPAEREAVPTMLNARFFHIAGYACC